LNNLCFIVSSLCAGLFGFRRARYYIYNNYTTITFRRQAKLPDCFKKLPDCTAPPTKLPAKGNTAGAVMFLGLIFPA